MTDTTPPADWHPLTIATDGDSVDFQLTHPGGGTCPPDCGTWRAARDDRWEQALELSPGEYRMRAIPPLFRNQLPTLLIENADGTPITDPDPAPVEIPDALLDAMAEAADRAVGDANHADLCGCDDWPEACKYYSAGEWDSGVWSLGLPAALAVWEQRRAT